MKPEGETAGTGQVNHASDQHQRVMYGRQESRAVSNDGKVVIQARAEQVTVRTGNEAAAPAAPVVPTDKAPRQIPISDAEKSASTAAALASASKAAEAAESASTVAAAEAAKRRATEQALANQPAAAATTATATDTTNPEPVASFTERPVQADTNIPVGTEQNPVRPTTEASPEMIANQQQQLAASGQTANAKTNKVGKGFIAALITLGVATVAAIGCAIWFFAIYSQPTTVVKDALAKLLAADVVALDTAFAARDLDAAQTLELSLSSIISSEYGASLSVAVDFQDTELGLDLSLGGTLLTPDYEQAYFKLDGTSDLYTSYMNYLLGATDTSTATTYTLEELEEIQPELAALHEFADSLDGAWWDLVGDDADLQEQLSYIKCAMSALGSSSATNRLIELYDQYPFLTAEQYSGSAVSGNAFVVEIDDTNLAAFLNVAYENVFYANLNTCYATSDLASSTEFSLPDPSRSSDVFTTSDVAALVDNLESTIFVIDSLTHQLEKIVVMHGQEDEDEYTYALVTEFSYSSSVSFTTPDNPGSLEELFSGASVLTTLFFGTSTVTTATDDDTTELY